MDFEQFKVVNVGFFPLFFYTVYFILLCQE